MKTKAAVLFNINTPFKIMDLDLDPPKANEVLIKMSAVGVCHSDWHLRTGDTQHALPVVPGHEGCGYVAEIGQNVSRVKKGEKVSLNWAPNCGECFYCKNGRPSLCEAHTDHIWKGHLMDGTSRLSIDGQHAYHYCALSCLSEYAVVPEESCIIIPDEIPDEVGALIGCAVTTGVGSVLNTAQVKRGDSVAVFGAGGVGLSTIMGAAYAGASRIISIDIVTEKASIAKMLGATDFILSGDNTIERIKSLTENRGVDYAFEAVGISQLQEMAMEAIRPGGTLILSGITPMGSKTNLSGAILVRQEKMVKGSYYGTSDTNRDFIKYAYLFLDGKLPIDKMISKRYSLEKVNVAFEDMINGQSGRGIIEL
ncbi:MAG: Zn-dependent alcohol dehydrogenase [Candidatus Marinimicrobia bacterium]|nr:Zn-dependent alcohol dehydrogenase [Candidatus Neomarinimicrobiota bacterium]